MNNWILDYIRMTAYALVILVSLFSLKLKSKFNWSLLIGNIILASFAFISQTHILFLGADRSHLSAVLFTPATVAWALFSFIFLIRGK